MAAALTNGVRDLTEQPVPGDVPQPRAGPCVIVGKWELESEAVLPVKVAVGYAGEPYMENEAALTSSSCSLEGHRKVALTGAA